MPAARLLLLRHSCVRNRQKKKDALNTDLTKGGYFGLFKKENCASGEVETFNLLPCDGDEELCQGFEPCVSTDMKCCQLAAGAI